MRKSDQLFRQADDLLRNVLPDDVAERLKISGEMIADEFGSASILFADVAGVPPMAAPALSPVQPWFERERRGVIEVRGNSEVETWFLTGRGPIEDRSGTFAVE